MTHKEPRIEVIAVGNEILMGRVTNTNASWISSRVAEIGGAVGRHTTVGDDVDVVASAVREALGRRVDLLLVTGGLGPTYDDRTLEGVAEALSRKLVLNRKALKWMKERYRLLAEEGYIRHAEITPSRLKMVTLPQGTEPLPNPVGSAPGVLIMSARSLVICLPGVPSEMKRIFTQSVKPLIRRMLGARRRAQARLKVLGVGESLLAHMLSKIVDDNPDVYVKSHPKGFERKRPKVEIHLVAVGGSKDSAEARVEGIVNTILEDVSSLGGEIYRVERLG